MENFKMWMIAMILCTFKCHGFHACSVSLIDDALTTSTSVFLGQTKFVRFIISWRFFMYFTSIQFLNTTWRRQSVEI